MHEPESGKCGKCPRRIKPHKWGIIKAHGEGWYFMKDGRTYCPDHRPEWAPKNWR